MRTCPRDGAGLTPSVFRGVPYALCPACAGLWFTRAALASPALAAATSTEPAALPPVDGAGPLACADCRTPLVARWLGGVEIDACPGCGGVWLDAREFDHVWAAYRRWSEGNPWWWAEQHPQALPGSDRPVLAADTASVAPAAFDVAARVAGAVLEVGLGALLGGPGGHHGGGGGGSFGGGGGFSGGGGGRSF